MYGCATSGLPDKLRAESNESSQNLQMSLEKAKQDGYLQISRQVQSTLNGLIKKIEDEAGIKDTGERDKFYNRMNEEVIYVSLHNVKILSRNIERNRGVYRASVVMETSMQSTLSSFIEHIGKNEELYRKFSRSKTFKNIEENIKKSGK